MANRRETFESDVNRPSRTCTFDGKPSHPENGGPPDITPEVATRGCNPLSVPGGVHDFLPG